MMVHEACVYAMQTQKGTELWNAVGSSDKIVNIYFVDAERPDTETDRFLPRNEGRTDKDLYLGPLMWDYNSRFIVCGGADKEDADGVMIGYLSPSSVLLHEIGHVADMIEGLKDGVKSDRYKNYRNDADLNNGHDDQYSTIEERHNTTENERPYLNQINKIESDKNGSNASYQRTRSNHSGAIEYRKSDSPVNKNPTKSEQQKTFNCHY